MCVQLTRIQRCVEETLKSSHQALVQASLLCTCHVNTRAPLSYILNNWPSGFFPRPWVPQAAGSIGQSR